MNKAIWKDTGDLPQADFSQMSAFTATRGLEKFPCRGRLPGGHQNEESQPSFSLFVLQSFALKAQQHKTNFQKVIDSVLAKSAKIRALCADLKKNYDDEAATKQLNRNLKQQS